MDGINDSGKRLQFGEGVREDATGKGRPDLISPFALERLAKWYEKGSIKYADRNWEKSTIPFSRYTASMFRHLIAWMQGKTDEDHLSAVCWNAFSIIHFQELNKAELNDMPQYEIEAHDG